MRFTCLYIFIGLSQIACFQQEVRIIKKCSSSGNESFVDKNYICQKLFYEEQKLIWKVNYSYNEWQIYDSIYYEYKDSNYCVKTFQPTYKEGNKVVAGYQLSNVDCDQGKTFPSGYFSQINDQYLLSRPYLRDLNFLLQLSPIISDNEFKFKNGISPSLFSQYGIPYNELLDSFSFVVNQDDLIESDNFYFINYTLKRKYRYENSRLQDVIIIVENKRTNVVSEFKEHFEIVN